MADVATTPADFEIKTKIAGRRRQCGEAIDATDVVYFNSADSKVYKAQADAASTATVDGIAHNGGSTDSYIIVSDVKDAIYDMGATLTEDTEYVLSAATAGSIAPRADLTTGNILSIIGQGNANGDLIGTFHNTGKALA